MAAIFYALPRVEPSRVGAGACFNGSQFIANKFVAKKFRARPENFQTFLFASVINLQHMCGRLAGGSRSRDPVRGRVAFGSRSTSSRCESSRARAKPKLHLNSICASRLANDRRRRGVRIVQEGGKGGKLLGEKCHFKRQPKIVVFIAA